MFPFLESYVNFYYVKVILVSNAYTCGPSQCRAVQDECVLKLAYIMLNHRMYSKLSFVIQIKWLPFVMQLVASSALHYGYVYRLYKAMLKEKYHNLHRTAR